MGNFGQFLIFFEKKIKHKCPPFATTMVESGYLRFRMWVIMYLTFSESFETIKLIVQKILCDPKKNFFKNCQLPVKGVKLFFAHLIFFHLLVQLPPTILQMLMPLLFYYVKFKNPDSPFLKTIFDYFFAHFWTP